MPSFSDSFWSSGYSTGLNVIFDKLRQGSVENDEVLALAAARADAEEAYGNRLIDIPSNFTAKKNGFGRDDGASLRKAYEGIIDEMGNEGQHHIQVAESIRRMVILPFGKWADDHRKRVDYSSNILREKLKNYERELTEVQKAQRKYFNKCRLLEDSRNVEVGEGVGGGGSTVASGGSVSGPGSGSGSGSVSVNVSRNVSNSSTIKTAGGIVGANATSTGTAVAPPITPPQDSTPPQTTTEHKDGSIHDDLLDDEDPVQLGDDIYSPDEAKLLFQKMLEEIPQKSVKVAILGTYEHVCSGDLIVAWVQANMSKDNATSLANAEKFGQSLITEGFLRLVGQVGSKFANSSVMNYQWKRKAFQIADRLEHTNEQAAGGTNLMTPIVGEYLGETINNYINNPHPDETPDQRLIREVNELDQKYKQAVQKLDDVRCNLEETAVDHLTFMERCEFDRLKAIKAVFLDFLAALSNVIPTLQVSVDKLLLYQETVQPANDLRYILESYRTGCFLPKVTIYDNYYNTAEDQIFGVELEYRCRGDKKRVPFIVSHVLGFMDSKYPEMENDQVRLSAWVVSVPLKTTHQLRRELNYGGGNPKVMRQILPKYEPPVVASLLKLYLVELPDSIIPSTHYDTIKSIYSQHGNDEDPQNRINSIQNTFSQLRVSNIATLDAVLTHLTRLTDIAKASPEYIGQLAQEFSNCVLRPKTQSALTLGDRHAYLLVKDLINYKDKIFRDLKRNNSNRKGSLSPSPSLKKGHVDVGAGAGVNRRPTLQNRMEALSLKIRKNVSHGEGETGEVSTGRQSSIGSIEQQHQVQQSYQQEQSTQPPHQQQEQEQTESSYQQPHQQEYPHHLHHRQHSNSQEHRQFPQAENGFTGPPVRTIESMANEEQDSSYYNSDESYPPRQPAAGRQDVSLTAPPTAAYNEEQGLSSHPIVID